MHYSLDVSLDLVASQKSRNHNLNFGPVFAVKSNQIKGKRLLEKIWLSLSAKKGKY